MPEDLHADLEQMLEDWDTAYIGDVCLPCHLTREFSDAGDVASIEILLRVAEHQVRGDKRLLDADLPGAGTTIDRVETVDGSTVGPYVHEVVEREDPGFLVLRLRDG